MKFLMFLALALSFNVNAHSLFSCEGSGFSGRIYARGYYDHIVDVSEKEVHFKSYFQSVLHPSRNGDDRRITNGPRFKTEDLRLPLVDVKEKTINGSPVLEFRAGTLIGNELDKDTQYIFIRYFEDKNLLLGEFRNQGQARFIKEINCN